MIKRQRQVENLQGRFIADHHAVDHAGLFAFIGHAQMPEHQQNAAQYHRFAHAQIAVGQQPADDRHRIHQAAVGAEQVVAGVIAEQVVFKDVKQQQRLHSVE